jgi:glycosyltransferase involved in cell wall biosynthesis
MCTDAWVEPWFGKRVALLGRTGRALADRWHPDLKHHEVCHWTYRCLANFATTRYRRADRYDRYLQQGSWFSTLAAAALRRRSESVSIVFSYDTTAVELFQEAKRLGIRRVVGQMDPGLTETELVAAERRRRPGWESEQRIVPTAYLQRRQTEWEQADRIVVNSGWSREALVRQGVPSDKITVIPLIYQQQQVKNQKVDVHDSRFSEAERGRDWRRRPLRVLFLGQVNLRKGIGYLIDAANLLKDQPVEFVVVGPIQLTSMAIEHAPSSVRFVGPVGRSEASNHYRQADMFILPTLSDGFALTQLEAMSYGLPVIATANCGQVVDDGVQGRIVPAENAPALASAVQEPLERPDLLEKWSEAALRRVKDFSMSRIAPAWLNLGRELVGRTD